MTVFCSSCYRSGSNAPSPAPSTGGSARALAATPQTASENDSAHGSGSGNAASDAAPNIVERLGLTQAQVDAILRVGFLAPAVVRLAACPLCFSRRLAA
jgi:hypothetical protein